ncbi:uncharacterized protein LOC126095664 [Schistocerca cancellata]|uniref:uncharacterized protein LOC126095664 n=1 Tax=Schistocerca cancellata TaxID=274614 RepID=UPI0021175298|nr:uncharacterized protein LOC126095664 [Schistocerca cancellata]
MSETIIDQVFINKDKCEYNTEVIDTGFSDHKGIELSLNVTSYKDPVINNNYRERIFINDDNIRIFNYILENNNWGSESSGDVNTKFDSFLESYKHCFDVAFPIKRVKPKHKTKTWFTQGIRKSSDTLRKLNKSARKNVALKAHVKCYRSLYKKVIIAAKKLDNDSYIEKGNNKMKSTWEVINKNIGRHKRKDNSFVIKSGGTTVKEPLQIANIFYKHFTNIAINLIKTKSNSNSKVKIPMNDMTMFLYPVTESEVLNAINKLKNKMSCGCDGIPDKVIKQSARNIASLLTEIINESFKTGVFPSKLIMSTIKPLYKNGDK